MGQIVYRLLMNATSLTTLVALIAPLLAPLAGLTLLSDAAQAAEAQFSSLEPTQNLADSQLKDDDDDDDNDDDDDDGRRRQNCNQGIGNGPEGCDPGNSRPRGGSNDEDGRTPGNRPSGGVVR
ncbi:MAG: hypothetical protein IGR92_06265 [Leptolyngbyaceae cyanobacterium T60_A2020_046]|nr:hypothetical protein [Leptolyngbyaceae cyanobacterium T60_A2020_046]